MAIEYSYQARHRDPNTWVFWIHAINPVRFEQSCQEIADRLKISGRKNPRNNIVKLLFDWLNDDRREDWVLILDNVDDDRFLHDSPVINKDEPGVSTNKELGKPISAYISASQTGSIIVTTRSKEIASRLVEESDIITVEPMDGTHALLLFEKKLGIKTDEEEAIELTTALELMPLAIAQAAAYIKQRAPRYSVSQYLSDFQKSDRKKTSLLDYEGGHLRRDRESKNSIIITWQISFDHVREIRPSAADLLSMMSFFDRQGIPEALLRSHMIHDDDSESERNESEENDIDYNNRDNEDDNDEGGDDENRDDIESTSVSFLDDEFEDDILTLRNYSFISVSTDQTFEMHGLVQLAMRKWLDAHGQLEIWKEKYIKNLYAVFPHNRYENWSLCQQLFPHVKAALQQKPDKEASLKRWASLLYKAARYALGNWNVSDAWNMSANAMKVRKKLLGPEDKETLRSIELVASAHELKGQWNKAEELLAQVLGIKRRLLGTEDISTLSSTNDLARVYQYTGRWKEAEELLTQTIESSKILLGMEHPFTLTSLMRHASMYIEQGKWHKAEEILTQVLDIGRRIWDTEDLETITSTSLLAATYTLQGRWQEAEKLQAESMKTMSKLVGLEHPDTLISLSCIAAIYQSNDQLQEAEELNVHVLQAYMRSQGPESSDTLSSMASLASTYEAGGQWQEAEKLLLQVVEASKRLLGTEHPSTLTILSRLGITYHQQGKWQESMELNFRVLETRERILGPEHPSTLSSMTDLAVSYRDQGQWQEAERMEARAMEAYKKVLGPEHPHTLDSMCRLSEIWMRQGRDADAIELGETGVQLQRKFRGPTHPHTTFFAAELERWRTSSTIPPNENVAQNTSFHTNSEISGTLKMTRHRPNIVRYSLFRQEILL